MNRSKAKGTRAETAVVQYLADHGVVASRLPLSGSSDIGDVAVPSVGAVLEVKAGKMTINPTRNQLEEWMRQLRAEKATGGWRHAWLIVARYRRSKDDWECWSEDGKMIWLDELPGAIGRL